MINTKITPQSSYFNSVWSPMLDLIAGTPGRVLEVGCAAGKTLAYLKNKGSQYLVGVEISEEAALLAKGSSGADEILIGNIETMPLMYEKESFDLILTSHVLEHLLDPWATLKRLVSYLKPGGQLVGAIPNVRHWSISVPLLFNGKWVYEAYGLMDWTHLRFFTEKALRNMLTSSGLEIRALIPDIQGPKSALANKLTLGMVTGLFAYAYNFSCFKPYQ